MPSKHGGSWSGWVKELQREFVMPSVEVWYDKVFVEGKGAMLKDANGKEYVDCFAGVSVVNIGHCHPKVTAVVKDQVEKLTHLSTLFYTEPMPKLAKRLSEIAPMDRGQPKKTFFCNSGTEANEHAVTLAKKYTRKNEFVGLQCGFYGRGGTTISLTGLGAWREGLGPFTSGVYHAPAYYCYRCPLGHLEGPPRCAYACAEYVDILIKTETSRRVAAFVAEPIYGVAGAIPAPPEYFKIVKETLDNHGILFICDEVQTGFGRTGKVFGIEHYGIEPDIVTLAKALGGGLPIGALVAKTPIADAYHGPHFSTFGGNPLSCRAALAGIDVLFEEGLVENAARIGDFMLRRLNEMTAEHPMLDDVRGKGLMLSVELVADRHTRKPASDEQVSGLMKEAANRGVILGRGGLFFNRIRLQPPLCITLQQAEKAMEALEQAAKSVETR